MKHIIFLIINVQQLAQWQWFVCFISKADFEKTNNEIFEILVDDNTSDNKVNQFKYLEILIDQNGPRNNEILYRIKCSVI